MGRRKLELGSVFEIRTPSGLGYFQYIGESKVYCELIRVFPETYERRPEPIDSILRSPEAFLTFYPIRRALSDGLVALVHHAPVPDRFRAFPRMRWGSAIPASGGPRKWRLFDGEDFGDFVDLTPALRKLSVTGTSGHASLQTKIATGYRPEFET